MVVKNYINNLIKKEKKQINEIFADEVFCKEVNIFSNRILEKIRSEKNIFICGNGGSAANSDHMENDILLASRRKKYNSKIYSLCSNVANITRIGNDEDYSKIFSNQLNTKGNKGDLLIVLSASGNSLNIINALKLCRKNKIDTAGIIGCNGGKALNLIDFPVHVRSNDVQTIENTQLIITHILMKFIHN